ncbi:hypothetical protein ACIQNI_08720 [Streptomyces sp. NPDC091266]|uniref:hypothetical protein n=1 Tax=Streptomyces sp. NPDC091266 TaxID=3365978 RepID=UPI003810C8FF
MDSDRPEPHPGCGPCAELDEQRTRAHGRGDGSAETDCSVLLRRHIKEAHA